MNRIEFLLILCFCSISLLPAQSQKSVFIIQNELADQEGYTLSRYNYELDNLTELKSDVQIEAGGSLTHKIEFTEPSLFILKLTSGKEIRIAQDKPGEVQLKIGEEITLHSATAQKSDFGHTIQQLNNHYFGDLIKAYDKAMAEENNEILPELEKQKDALLIKFIAAMENKIAEMGPSVLAFDAMFFLDLHKNYQFIKEMTDRFQKSCPDCGMTRSLTKRIAKAERVAVGNTAPEIEAVDRYGKAVTLGNYKGKYVLVDFWATWCRSCIVDNPKLVRLHDKFSEKGFDIIAVSQDSDEDAWVKAIEKDGITWANILDRNYSITNLFMVSSLPSNYLLDKEGKIIAKNLNPDQLGVKLETIFGN